MIAAFLLGFVAGLRTLTPLAAVSWAAHSGWLPVADTWLAFLGYRATPWILTLLAIGELVNDKLPKTPSRKEPVPFGARIVSGAVAGAAVTSPALLVGLGTGAAGAIVGTFAGYEFRRRLVQAIGGKDLPVALLEDAIAVLAAALLVTQFQ